MDVPPEVVDAALEVATIFTPTYSSLNKKWIGKALWVLLLA
jgi:hypothetical protein